MKILFTFLQFASLLFLSTCVDLECDFINHASGDYIPIGTVYTCRVKNDLNIDSPGMAITSVSTNHSSGKTHDDVQGIYDQNGGKNIQFFPRGLDKIFKNIIMIDLNNGRIKEIHQIDLKVFPKLEALDLYDNDIQVIEAGTFDFNPNLKVIWLTNKILHVESNVFESLNGLIYLYLPSNPCIDKSARNSLIEVNNLAQEAYAMCFNSEYSTLNQKLIEIESEDKTCENVQSLKERLENLEIEIQHSNFSYLSSFKRRIEAEYLVLANVEEDCALMCNDNLDDIRKGIADLNKKVDNLENLIRDLIDEIQNKCGAIGECIEITPVPETITTKDEIQFGDDNITNGN
ncbi:hypothetical protein ACKWTF_013960 [Chironomus riparius]